MKLYAIVINTNKSNCQNLLPEICPIAMTTEICKNVYTRVYSALLVLAQMISISNSQTIFWFTHTMEYYTAIDKNKTELHELTKKDVRTIVSSEKNNVVKFIS